MVHGGVNGPNDSFWHWKVSGLAIFSVAACFSSRNIHSVDFLLHFSYQRASTAMPSCFLVFNRALPPFYALAFACHSIPHHTPNVSISDTTSLIQLAKFSILFSGNSYK